MKVAILDDYQSVAASMADWSRLPPGTQVQYFHDHIADPDALVRRLKEFQVVMGMRERTPFPKAVLARLPALRLLITSGGRNAAFDTEAATELGIAVCGTTGEGEGPTELTWGLILGIARQIPQEDQRTRQGQWGATVGVGLHGKTLGLLGLGHIGSQVARVGNAFDMNVVAWSQNLTAERAALAGAAFVSKDGLFRTSDFVSIQLVLSDRSRGLVGAAELALMKPTAILVNTSRGPIVDESAMLAALRSGRLAHAALDVYGAEPLPADHPLRRMDNVTLSPHLGYVSEDVYRTFWGDCVENVEAWLDGKPIRVLNPGVLNPETQR